MVLKYVTQLMVRNYCPVNLMERTGEVWFPGSESKDLLPRQGKFDDYIEC